MRAAYMPWNGHFACGGLLMLSVATWLPAQQVAEDDEQVSNDAATSLTSLEPPRTTYERPAHLFVVRISADVLSQQLNQRVDYTTSVRDVVLGTPVSGVARLVGQPHVQLVPSENQARFNVVFSGTIYSRTVGDGGPATIYGHSVTAFTATKEVIFEPGKGFHALPPRIAATTRSYTDNIATSRGGLIGRIIQRRASEEVAAKQPQITAIARDRAVRRVAAAFEQQMTNRIAHLNQSVDFQVQLAGLRTREGSRKLMACTTPQYVEIADMINNGNSAALNLPVRPLVPGTAAPIEVWINSTLVPDKVKAELKTVFTSPDQSAVINALALLPGMLGKEAAAAITALASQHKVQVDNVGDWLVLDINGTREAGIPATAAAPDLSAARNVRR